jgi:lipoic acid synthetase
LGETREEINEAFRDLRNYGVDIVTLGQYLRPTLDHLPVEHYWTPEQFQELYEDARGHGFLYVASGAMVRSSYKASELFVEGLIRSQKSMGPATKL